MGVFQKLRSSLLKRVLGNKKVLITDAIFYCIIKMAKMDPLVLLVHHHYEKEAEPLLLGPLNGCFFISMVKHA